jgi:MFS family permease
MSNETSQNAQEPIVNDASSRFSPLRVTGFRWLLSAQLVSEIGDWSARVALQLLVLERTGSAALSALVIAVSLAPWIGIGQVLAGIGDRFPRRSVLIISDLSRGAIFVALGAFEMPIAMILALAFVAGCFDPPFEASRSAVLPKLVGTSIYGHALAMTTYVSNTGLLTGYVVGGGLSGWIGPRGALLLNAATFGVSAFFVSRIPNDRDDDVARRPDLRAAARFVIRDRVVLWSVVVYGAVAFFGMSVEGIAAPYGVDVLRLADTRIGILLAMVPLGTILGTLVMRPEGSDRRLIRISSYAALFAGAVAVPVFLLNLSGLAAHIGFFAIGVGFAASIPTNTAAGRRIPDDIRASTFGILQGIVVGSHALGAAVGGVVANATDVSFAATFGGASLAVIGIIVLAFGARMVGGVGDRSEEGGEVDREKLALRTPS